MQVIYQHLSPFFHPFFASKFLLINLKNHLVIKFGDFRNFKDRSKKQGRKDEVKWKLLVKKILWTKGVARTPFFLTTETI